MPGSPGGARGDAGGRNFVDGYYFDLVTAELVFVSEYASEKQIGVRC